MYRSLGKAIELHKDGKMDILGFMDTYMELQRQRKSIFFDEPLVKEAL